MTSKAASDVNESYHDGTRIEESLTKKRDLGESVGENEVHKKMRYDTEEGQIGGTTGGAPEQQDNSDGVDEIKTDGPIPEGISSGGEFEARIIEAEEVQVKGEEKKEEPVDTNKKNVLPRIKGHRWRTHQMAEDYVEIVGEMMYPGVRLGPFGYDFRQGMYPVEHITTLGLLTSPLRRPTVIEKWSPLEIATFEAAISLYGKLFHRVQKVVKTKTTKEVVEFYYVWKKTSHYKRWKQVHEPDITSEDEGGTETTVRRRNK